MRIRSLLAGSPVFPIVEGRALLFVLALLTACAPAGDASSAGETRSHITRVVSLLPSATETLVALGAGGLLAARTDYDLDPSLQALPSLGRTLEPNAEALLALSPELVIVPEFSGGNTRLIELMKTRAVPVLQPRLHTLADLYTLIDTLGVLLGRSARAVQLRSHIRTQLQEVRRAAAGDSLNVLYVVWPTPARVAAAGTFTQEILTIAGARNAVADLEGWPEISMEEVLRRKPEVIVLPIESGQRAAIEWLAERVGWRELEAVRRGRVITVNSDLFNRPSPNVVLAARELASALRAQRSDR
jgi:iron complex transport system substrate-binding protein